MLTILLQGTYIETTPSVQDPTENQRTRVLIDGHAMVQLLGKPSNGNTFDDYAMVFLKCETSHVTVSVIRVDLP